MLSNEKQSRTTPKVVSMAKEVKKDVKVEEDAANLSEIYDYIVHKTYPSHADKLYKYGLRMVEKGVRNLAWWLNERRRGE